MVGVDLTDTRSLRRRHPGDRTLIYLDQSALSALVRDNRRQSLLILLRNLVSRGIALCPQSMNHVDESLLHADLYQDLDDLADELSAGISFNFDDNYTLWSEISSAVAAFLGEESPRDVWREAFVDDPQKPIDQLHPPFRVRARSMRQEWMVREVENERAKAELLRPVRAAIHASRRTFREQAALEYSSRVGSLLEPLLDPDAFSARLDASVQRMAVAMLSGDIDVIGGSAYSRHAAVYMRRAHCESLSERHPALPDKIEEFAKSAELASMPSLRFPALLHAALATGSATKGPARSPKPSDLHDIAHLTLGLGRCDIVTCDSSMAQLCRERRLVPNGVLLFSARELDDLERTLTTLG
jgi:hypothetical protein